MLFLVAVAELLTRHRTVRHAAAAVDELPDDLREALRRWEDPGCSELEAAAALGLRRGELRGRVLAAREELALAAGVAVGGCRPVRAELAVTARGVAASPRLQRHVLRCPECAAWAEEVERQRDAAHAAAPVRTGAPRARPGVRRAATAIAVATVAGTGGYLGVAALQGDTPSPTPAAKAAADTR